MVVVITGGGFSEVVVSSGLTVLQFYYMKQIMFN
jgi:hypothetical protein